MLESRQQLLSLLTADGRLDAAAAAAGLLLAQPALVPGLLPAADLPAKESQSSAEDSQETKDSQQEQEGSEKEQESQETPAVTREQLAGALDALVLAADPSADPERQMLVDKQKMMVLYFKVRCRPVLG